MTTSWPEHQNPGAQRTASAPYNFVPLPEMIIPVVSDARELPDHDKYYSDLQSGYFDVTLTTRSPLYIRGPIAAEDFPHQEDALLKNNPPFFHTGDERIPVIPGSSLRGMLRALLEIVSYSKMQWVSEKQLFFRTVDNTAIGRYYRSRMGTHVETGFLMRRGDTYYIKVCSMARVRRSMIDNPIYNGTQPNQVPLWQGLPRQYAPVWVRLRARTGAVDRPDLVEELSYQKRVGMSEGRLVITGNVPRKRKEFAFLLPGDDAEEIIVSEEIISRFHDEDQLTQWQEEAFPTDQPAPDYRERNGMLGKAPVAPGDPIFFLRENGKLTFIGRAQMFRLPYKQRPIDLVPHELRQVKDIDYAEALFGFVRTRRELDEMGKDVPQGDKRRAYAGRVIVTDAVLQSDPADIWLAGAFHPRILATPKPTAFQQYLTQQHPDDKRKLDHYDSALLDSDKTTIRGHKLYWHQGLGTDQGLTLEQIRATIEEPARVSSADTQHTRFKPLKPGVQFSFRVYFENLSDRELGALCWTLHPNGEPKRHYCHHLGMGKPLGMGAVELHARLHIIDRTLRYRKLFNSSRDNWQLGESVASESSSESSQPTTRVDKATTGEDLTVPEVLTRLTQPFEEHLLGELNQLNPYPPCERLADMLRIAILLKLLEWPGYPAEKGGTYLAVRSRPNTRYMELGEYRDRPVLPDPTRFDALYFGDKSRPRDLRAVILTASKVEYQAVRAHLRYIREDVYKGTIYERGAFQPGNQLWDVGIAQIGAGNVGAAFEAERAIDYLKPDIILFVGVTSGIKDVKIGDVVVATKVYGYEFDRASNTFRTRPDISQSSYRLIQRAQAEARKTDWLQLIEEPFHTTPQVFVGPIVAGEKLMASAHFAIREFLQRTYGDSLALEMEGSGFLPTISTNEQAQILVIRGISDLIDHPKSNVQNLQEIAARHASAFAFEILSKMNLPQELSKSEQLWQSLVSLISSQKQSIPLHTLEEITQLLISSLGIGPGERVLPTDWTPFFWTKLYIQPLFHNIHLPSQIPIIFYTASLFDESNAEVLRELRRKTEPQTSVALLCLFIASKKHIDEALSVLKNTLQNAYAYDIVPLLYNDFVGIVEARDPQKAFQQYLLSRINLNVASPFNTSGPTTGSMFFGREHELRTISTHARNASYALIGGRRIGKTSILKQLELNQLPEAGFHAFYHDCSPTPTQAELVRAFTLDRIWFPNPPVHQPTSFVEVLQALPNDKPLVILLDEADRLIGPDQALDYPLLRTLRALANSGRCQFVFSGEHSLRDELTNPKSPLYNFANEMLIGRLDPHAVRELIIQPMSNLGIKLIDEEDIVDRIWEFTSGHPNVVQLLCRRLVNRLNEQGTRRVTLVDVEAVTSDPEFQEADFLQTYWEAATPLEKIITLVLSQQVGTYGLQEIHQLVREQLPIQPSIKETRGALDRLVGLRSLLVRSQAGYTFAVKAFPRVLNNRVTVKDLLSEFIEEYSGVDHDQ
jgi:CRISPR-associated protein (TIGR03986 family)